MRLSDVEERVEALDTSKGFDLIYDLLLAYGLPKASITRLQKGTYDKSLHDAEVLWKQKVWYRYADDGTDLLTIIDEAKADARITAQRPRFLIVRDDEHLLALDTHTASTLDTPITALRAHTAFFLPWAGIEKTQLENINYADRKAAEKMAVLYDEITKHNAIETDDDVRTLNIFFSRLLFCFFAEDTGVFPQGLFTNTLASLTREDGSDTASFLDDLFEVLDTERSKRQGVPAHFEPFDWVNGKLFANDRWTGSPQFSRKARRIILECATLDWSEINPDIFGSMIQAVVQPGQRENLGMHYTSVENIMKVIRPLFLDDLEEVFRAADTPRKLDNLLNRIAAIKCFDPACGSGNFLVIAYKELRRLEHQILARIRELDPSRATLFANSVIKLEHFYGIEIDDFAHEVAILSLYLAKHQMNVEFHELFQVEISLIPLRDTGNITCGNATRVDWNDACPTEDGDEVYVLGNPPYRGITYQTAENKEDARIAFAPIIQNQNLDYVASWFIKGARFLQNPAVNGVGFVSTNSICQGTQVAMLWPHVFDLEVEIAFAHTSFRWSNQAKGNAGVSVVVIGLERSPRTRVLFGSDYQKTVTRISPYLVASENSVIVQERGAPISELPRMNFGNKPTDNGAFTLLPSERDELVRLHPGALPFIRRFLGAAEYLRGVDRYCLWIPDEKAAEAYSIAPIRERIDRVASFRAASKNAATRELANRPHRFQQARHRPGTSVVIPAITSERREYIPASFLDEDTVVSNKMYVVYDAEPWVFAILQSRLHLVWTHAVCGRLETRISYSNGLCYNTFTIPPLSDDEKDHLTEFVFAVLDARERYAGHTLAQLYDPDKMPPDLRAAHERLDLAVERLYRSKPFESDDERLEHLFERYEAAATELARA